MNYIDIIIIALVALGGLLGLWKGTGKTLIKFICFAITIVATYFIATKLTDWLLGVGFVRKFIVGEKTSFMSLYLNKMSGIFAGVEEGAKLTGLLGSFVNPMIDRYTAIGGPTAYGLTYSEFVALHSAVHLLNIIACILVYGIVRLVVALISKLLKAVLLKGDQPGKLSRIFGFIFGATRGVALVIVIFILASTITPFKFADKYNTAVNESVLGEFVTEKTYSLTDNILYGKGAEKTEKLLVKLGYENLNDLRAKNVGKLDNHYKEKVTDDNKALLEPLLAKCKDNINNATTKQEIEKAYNDAIEAIDAASKI